MRLVQFRGPFEYLEEFNVPITEEEKCVHLGIQIPWPVPLQYLDDNALSTMFALNGGSFLRTGDLSFYVNQQGMLEFDELNLETVQVRITNKKGLPANSFFEFGIEKTEEEL